MIWLPPPIPKHCRITTCEFGTNSPSAWMFPIDSEAPVSAELRIRVSTGVPVARPGSACAVNHATCSGPHWLLAGMVENGASTGMRQKFVRVGSSGTIAFVSEPISAAVAYGSADSTAAGAASRRVIESADEEV